MPYPEFFAVDIGAESGRCVAGKLIDDVLKIREIRRFPNNILNINGHLHWDIYKLHDEILKAIKKFSSNRKELFFSVGIDTWGVDFGLLDESGNIIENPYSYRDNRTNGIMEKVFEIIPKKRIYELTGIQFMQINTLYQLYALKLSDSPVLESAYCLLFMPDLLNYLLTGSKYTEYTIATTSQLYNHDELDWEDEILDKLDIYPGIMMPIVNTCTSIGSLKPGILPMSSIIDYPVISVASHDTASAVVAIPAENENFAYISSGTWSLMGIETPDPVINNQTLKMNFTNEGGIYNTIRFLKNIMGLWLLQRCSFEWSKKRKYTYEELAFSCLQAAPFKSLIDPDDSSFLNPADMPVAIINFCKKTGQPVPIEISEFVRCIFESLALKYKYVLEQIKSLDIKPIETIHIIGGGSQNKVLCQFTANATGLPVIAGPAEATVIGNIMVQAMYRGYGILLEKTRKIIRNSFITTCYKPVDQDKWEDAYMRFLKILSTV